MYYSKDEITSIEEADKVGDLLSNFPDNHIWKELKDVEIPNHLKSTITTNEIQHRKFIDSAFWKRIPAFNNVSHEKFLEVKFQNKHTVRNVGELKQALDNVVDRDFLEDVQKGIEHAPMNLRISPYLLSLIDWSDPYNDPLRIQFIPVVSSAKPDHPKLKLDSLGEQHDSPVDGIVHRYFDKALFLPLDVCPVYCRFCTRSYAIGGDTDLVVKVNFKPAPQKWKSVFAYIASRPELEDIVISGGDAYMLAPLRIRQIGETLLDIPHIRRIRFASKGPAVMPMKILSDTEWTKALIDVVNYGRKKGKEVAFHTHFNSANEITAITEDAMLHLFKNGVTVRNQSVLIKGVNDTPEKMIHLVRKLSYMNVQPYYVYQHDMVKGVEDMRTSIAETVELEKNIRGITAGFNTPLFVTDAPGGGGKRDVHSYDFYDEITGISIYRSPNVDESKLYLYFDPIDSLPKQGQEMWRNPSNHDQLVRSAIEASGFGNLHL